MGIGPLAGQLLESIVTHRLDARHTQLATIRSYIEKGMLAEDMAWSYLHAIAPLVQQAQDHPNLLHRPPTFEELYANGPPDIQIGSLAERPDVPFGLRYLDRVRSILVAGNTGSGKTTFISNLLLKTHELNARQSAPPVSLFVINKKLDYSHLRSVLGDRVLHLSIHDPSTKISLAAPHGVPPNVWINLVASIFSARAGLVAAWTCLANMMRFLLAAMNPQPAPDQPLRWPSLKLLLQVAKGTPLSSFAAKHQYEQSLIQALEAIVHTTDTFDAFTGLDIERDVIAPRRYLVLDIPNFQPAWVRQFCLDLLFAQILCGRIHRHQKTDRTEVIIAFDEADQDASYDGDCQFPDHMPPLAQMLRMGREYGIMAVIGLSRLRNASPYVLGEPQYLLILNQSDAASIEAARRTLLLPSGAEAMLPGLQSGTCIAREAQGPWEHPMLVKIDQVPLGRGPLPSDYDSVSFVPHADLDQLPEVQEAIRKLLAAKQKEHSRQTKPKELFKDAHRLLHTMAAHPWAPAAALWRLSGNLPTPSVQKTVRKQLEDLKLADNEEQRMGRANVLLYSLTERGYEYLGLTPPKRKGRGGIAHRHISQWIAECGKREGYPTSCEWVATGTTHPTDCAWQISNGMWDVFEVVVTSPKNLVDHLTSLSTSPAVRNITIVCLQKQIVADLSAKLGSEPIAGQLGDRLRWDVAETYLRKLYP